jgi:hypothetical protein
MLSLARLSVRVPIGDDGFSFHVLLVNEREKISGGVASSGDDL